MPLNASLLRYAPTMLSVLRIVAALIFLEHGSQKLLGFPAGPNGMPAAFTLGWWSGVVELTTGILLAIGFLTRIAAFVASGEMAFAYFIAHAPRGFYPILNGGDAAILYCFVFLFFVFAGAGAISLDAVRARSQTP